MTDLADFLLARIAEDEKAARGATAGPWEPRPYWFTSDTGRSYAAAVPGVIDEEIDTDDAEHITRWDPARVLAECEAKRRIVELHAAADEPGFAASPDYWAGTAHLDDVLSLLALPYVDHPDYREEWQL